MEGREETKNMMFLLVFILALFEGIGDHLQVFTETDSARERADTSSARKYGEEYDYSIFRSDCKRVPVGTATLERRPPPVVTEDDDDEDDAPPEKPPSKRGCTWDLYWHSNRILEI
jgi:hypothetical protein